MAHQTPDKYRRLTWALVVSSLASVLLFVMRLADSGSYRYWFLIWNLFLAWLPVLFAVLLYRILKTRSWGSWQALLMTLLWLGFVPNSFYIVTDFIHLKYTGEVSLLFDAAMFTSFVINGLILGYVSLVVIHFELIKRIKASTAHWLVAIILLACSFGIYLGRYLRWNTWDVLVSPAGLLFDVTDRLVNPVAHPNTFTTTMTFFILLGGLYVVVYQMAKLISSPITKSSRRS